MKITHPVYLNVLMKSPRFFEELFDTKTFKELEKKIIKASEQHQKFSNLFKDQFAMMGDLFEIFAEVFFDSLTYLQNHHWFNELNPDSALELLYIFGPQINLAVGPAQALSTYPETNGIWNKGIYRYCDSRNIWFPVDTTLQLPPLSQSKALF